jgi:site-specific recombinase XerC
LFVAERAEAGAAPNTLRAQVRAIEQVHDETGVTTVGFGRLAADVIAGVEQGRRAARRRAPVLATAVLRRMAGTAQNIAVADDDLAALRDWLMLAVGYGAGLGVGDLHAARLENLQRTAAGYALRLTDRRATTVLLAGRDDTLNPISAIDTWQDWTGLRSGPLLPVVPQDQPGRPLSTDAMVERLQRLAARAGSSVRPTGETLRRSWATHAYEAGLDLLSINRRLRRTHDDHSARQVATSLSPWPGHPAIPLTGGTPG